MAPKLILIGFEPMLRDLLARRLSDDFDIVGAAGTAVEALAVTRGNAADAVLVDADAAGAQPGDLIAKLSLVGPAPIVAIAAGAVPGRPETAALLAAGARAVVHKPAGPLPLDLGDGFGEKLITVLRQAAQP